MDLLSIKDSLLDFFLDELDHSLIGDQSNDPFVQISLINASPINPHRDSFGLYFVMPGNPAKHTGFTTSIMAAALALEGNYLFQKPSTAKPIEDVVGCTRGIPFGHNQVLIVTVISNLDDARFVCKSVIKKLQIILGKK